MNVDISQIVFYINIFFVFIIFICGLIGFIRGTLKSSYYMVVTLLILGVSWIFMSLLSNKLAYIDLSKFNLVVDGILVETPMQLINSIVERDYSQYSFLFVEGSHSLSLLEGIVGFGAKFVLYIILIVSLFTVCHLIFGIIWLFVKKPLRRKFAKKSNGEKKPRKTFGSRVLGFGLGLTKGLIYILLISILFAGISSMSSSVENVLGNTQEIAVVCSEDTITVVELQNKLEVESSASEYQMIFDILDAYHDTVPGKIFGNIKLGDDDTSIDVALSDIILSITTDNGNINLRKEVIKVGEILSSETFKNVMNEGFDIKKLHNLDKGELKRIINTLSSLDIIKVVVPVGVEFIVNSDLLVDKFGDGFKEIQDILKHQYNQLIDVDYSSDIQKLGYAFIDVIYLLGDDIDNFDNVDFFNFDKNAINEIFSNIENMELLRIIAPVVVNNLLSLDSVKQAIEKTGFTMEDLGLTSDIDYVYELMCIKGIYGKLTELNIKRVDGKIDLTSINEDNIDGFVDELFKSNIIKKALPVVVSSLLSSNMPEEFSNIITKEEVEKINWEKEFTPLLKAAATLIKTNILNSENKVEVIMNLDDSIIAELGTNLSKSELFVNNLDEIIIELLKTILGNDVVYEKLDPSKGEVWTDQEIISLFKAFKKLSKGLSFELSDSEIEEMADILSSSTFIKKNLNNIISSLTSELGVEIILLNNDEWTYDEIYSTIKGICLFMDEESGSDSFVDKVFNFTDDELNTIINSKFLSQIFANEITKLSNDSLKLPTELQSYESPKWYGSNGELIRLIKGLKLILSDNSNLQSINFNDLLDTMISVFGDEEDSKVLLSSIILSETIKQNLLNIDFITDYAEFAFTNNNKDINDTKNWYSFDSNNNPEEKELYKLMRSINALLGNNKFNDINTVDMDLIIENELLYPTFDSEYNVTNSVVEIILDSVIIEEAFARVVKSMFDTNGYLSNVLKAPSDANWYKKDVVGSEEYDLKTFIESFIIVQKYLDFENIKDIEHSGSSIRKLSTSEIADLATGMVISRTFRNNIAIIFNAIFTVEFANMANDPTISQTDKIVLATWWANNMFKQSDFDNVSRSIARSRVVAKVSAVCEELNG